MTIVGILIPSHPQMVMQAPWMIPCEILGSGVSNHCCVYNHLYLETLYPLITVFIAILLSRPMHIQVNDANVRTCLAIRMVPLHFSAPAPSNAVTALLTHTKPFCVCFVRSRIWQPTEAFLCGLAYTLAALCALIANTLLSPRQPALHSLAFSLQDRSPVPRSGRLY